MRPSAVYRKGQLWGQSCPTSIWIGLIKRLRWTSFPPITRASGEDTIQPTSNSCNRPVGCGGRVNQRRPKHYDAKLNSFPLWIPPIPSTDASDTVGMRDWWYPKREAVELCVLVLGPPLVDPSSAAYGPVA